MKLSYLLVLLFLLSGTAVSFDYDESDLDQFNSTDSENDDNDYSDENCSIDSLIDKFVEHILPDDYEEGKRLDFNKRSNHLNETIATFKRLHQYSQNVSKKLDPIIKRVMPRITDMLLLIDLPPDCMASLVRIGQSAQNQQQWALKCGLDF